MPLLEKRFADIVACMDWTKVIGELVDLGYTQPQIAKECNCGQATVSDLSRGETGNPRFSTAKALLDLLARARRSARKTAKAA